MPSHFHLTITHANCNPSSLALRGSAICSPLSILQPWVVHCSRHLRHRQDPNRRPQRLSLKSNKVHNEPTVEPTSSLALATGRSMNLRRSDAPGIRNLPDPFAVGIFTDVEQHFSDWLNQTIHYTHDHTSCSNTLSKMLNGISPFLRASVRAARADL